MGKTAHGRMRGVPGACAGVLIVLSAGCGDQRPPSPIAPGAPVKHATKDNAGLVTSSIVDGDSMIALAYLHKSCWEPGGTVQVDGRTGTIHALPW